MPHMTVLLSSHRSEQQRPSAEPANTQKSPLRSYSSSATGSGPQGTALSSMSKERAITTPVPAQPAKGAAALDDEVVPRQSEATAKLIESEADQAARSQPGNEPQAGSTAGIVPAKWGSEQDLQVEGFLQAPESQAEQPAANLGPSGIRNKARETEQKHESPTEALVEVQSQASKEKPRHPPINASELAGERSPQIPFGLATAGGSGMDFFNG